MIKLYVCEISNLINKAKEDVNSLEFYFDKLEKQRIEYILKKNRAEDKARSLGASYLLLFALEKEGILLDKLPDFSYTQNGKPYLEECPDVYFNISHAKNIITCVISRHEIGVDVEYVREIGKSAIKRVFTENERQFVRKSKEEYIRFWTMKEAWVKLVGTGIKDIWEGVEITKENEEYNIKKLNQDITKAICYKIVANGKLSDSKENPYYYSICAKTEQPVDVIYTKWNNHQIEDV